MELRLPVVEKRLDNIMRPFFRTLLRVEMGIWIRLVRKDWPVKENTREGHEAH